MGYCRAVVVLIALAGYAALPAQAAFVPPPEPMPPIFYEPCPDVPDVAGCVDFTRLGGRPAVFLTDQARSTRLHELGHVFDFQHMTDPLRHRFARIMGYRWRDWSDGTTDGYGPAPLAERFAVAYQVCAMHRQVPGWRQGYVTSYAPGVYDYEVSERQHLKVCALIRSARPS